MYLCISVWWLMTNLFRVIIKDKIKFLLIENRSPEVFLLIVSNLKLWNKIKEEKVKVKIRPQSWVRFSGQIKGWDEAPISKGPCLTRVLADQAWQFSTRVEKWNERNGWCEGEEIGVMKYEAGKNRKILERNLRRLWFVHHELHVKWLRCKLGTLAAEGECSKTAWPCSRLAHNK